MISSTALNASVIYKRSCKLIFLATFYCALACLITGCTKSSSKGSPQSVLSDYVGKSMIAKNNIDKLELTKLTTGTAKKSLESLDDQAFKTNFIDIRREFVSMKIRDERALSENRYSITYEISYKNHSPNSDDLVTIKKHALLTKENDSWFIAEVQNIKTNIEHQNAISF